MIVRKLFTTLIFGYAVCYGTGVLAALASPTDQIRSAVNEVLVILQSKDLQSETRRQGIRDAIGPYFDFRAMSQSTLALNWKKATPEQKNRFVALYRKLLENTYIVAMEEYSGETVRYGAEKVRGKRASVETFIQQLNGPEIPIIYRMRQKQEKWLAYDVIIEGISLVSNYRRSFRQIAEKEGMETLLKKLKQKVDSRQQAEV